MPKTFRFRYSKLQHPVDRAFVSVQTRFSTIQSYGRIDRICGSSSSNSSSIAVASAIVASTAYTWRLALVGTEEPGLHTTWPRLTGFCAGKFALNDERESVHADARAGQRAFSAHADGFILYIRLRMRATTSSPGCTSARVNARPNRMVENYAWGFRATQPAAPASPSIHVLPVIYSSPASPARVPSSRERSGGSTRSARKGLAGHKFTDPIRTTRTSKVDVIK